ncbi:hypothetical protein OG985_48155 [Streptomyces sp. NBC_00289]|uniref:hypothetical protein n=1 Tax=Streptomyces sp. NBC_00289 TaxID=2975703 RepID=UPI003254300A
MLAYAAAEYDYRPVSEAMVNMRYRLHRAEAAGLISANSRAWQVHRAMDASWPDGNWPRHLHQAQADGLPSEEADRLWESIGTERPDLKSNGKALHLLARPRERTTDVTAEPFVFETTNVWQRMQAHQATTPL